MGCAILYAEEKDEKTSKQTGSQTWYHFLIGQRAELSVQIIQIGSKSGIFLRITPLAAVSIYRVVAGSRRSSANSVERGNRQREHSARQHPPPSLANICIQFWLIRTEIWCQAMPNLARRSSGLNKRPDNGNVRKLVM